MAEGPEAKDGSGGDPEIKVTDKRMFTSEGELREEYRHLGGAEPAEPETEAAAAPQPPPAGPAPGAPEPSRRPEQRQAPPAPGPGAPPPPEARPEMPDLSGPGSPGFFDLVAMLAESAAVYLGDAALPDGESAENLEMARMHIDLLNVLRHKTAGNLSAQESTALEDVLYQLRMRYVQKRG